MSSSDKQPSNTSAGELHQQFKKMTIEYGFMMAGVSPEMIGSNQADRLDPEKVDFSALSKLSNDELELVIQKLVYDNKDAMTKPSNSCGDQSNQICELFLGIEGADNFFKIDYDICVKPGDVFHDLQKLIVSSGSRDRLIRFEIDRGKEFYVFVLKDIKTQEALASKLSRIYQPQALVLLDGLLCFINSSKMTILSISQEEKKYLTFLFSVIQEKMTDDIYFSWMDPDNEYSGIPLHLNDKNFVAAHQENFSALSNIITRHSNSIINIWNGSHSYTLFIPGNSKSDDQASSALTILTREPISLYHYQAHIGAHTLQEWVGGNKANDKLKFNTIAQYSLQEYMQVLADLVSDNGKTRAKAYGHLFRQYGNEEEKFHASTLGGASAKERNPLRLKYKLVSVNPSVAKINLDNLQDSFKEFGNDQTTQVSTYRKRTIEAFSEKLRTYIKEAAAQAHSASTPGTFSR